jgi:hypothetical protein
MWLESTLGLCVGCKIYGLLARRGWIAVGPDGQSCAEGYCATLVLADSARERATQR